ncbi:polysaccharide deacetylase family protein [Leucobacter denitrificans]|uniref:Polysaccharide deacetylase n=1 Tax=Leucobacter denitrificans TaxID=683042 RepID=A0A7G9S291_9MICO|nr:polysaccharide deacetylase [Leucobacter denitrificans]QNN61966.1 polysaccharide deacetylase [Leucobacter denitrificans]
MSLQMPEGKRLAISLSPDFDAHSVWIGTFRTSSQSALSRGEFGAEVGAPRLLETFARYGITTTWCIPTHTMQTFPERVAAVVDAGHEVAAHGVWHEYVPKLELDEERRLMELQLNLHEKHIGRRPRGYRSPALDITDNTLSVLEEFGLEWDSSLMGRDFEPYHPRLVTSIDLEQGNSFGKPSSVLEIPVSWGLDDFPELELLKGNATQQSNEAVFQRWKDAFDFAYERCPGGIATWTLHPQTIGRSYNLLMLERFIEYMQSHEGVWFPTLSEVVDAWRTDDNAPANSVK